ncbi:hypothetical protein [Leifsonia sp. Leaf336]|uniref:hypothetical protein n=1 Tax=Leifsonia sp. Leaf336 TaxID=1736341 RepID=UPI000A885710|nr:hypothetical protein [Leifsonia sp. Leaf336]
MSILETRISIPRGVCPRCGTSDARPAIVTTLAGRPAFVLVCDRCGGCRGYNG